MKNIYGVYEQKSDSYKLVIDGLTKKQAIDLIAYLEALTMNFEIYKILLQ